MSAFLYFPDSHAYVKNEEMSRGDSPLSHNIQDLTFPIVIQGAIMCFLM